MSVGRVYLVGAGPGDPELLTLRAARRLREADRILYDALVHPEILAHARPEAVRTFVGKRAGQPSARQEAIHAAMLEAARAGEVVVRLKGGDPFLFGRGAEEAEFLAAHGVPFEVVPGVPSPLAAVAYAGFSLTHRDHSASVAYLTATERPERDGTVHDFAKLATATQTLVFFMGVRKLDGLMETLIAHGRPAETPAAVIQWASMPEQRTVVGTVADIAQRARDAGIGMPALTVVGEVVKLRDRLRWWDSRPLFGRRVLVTRARDQASALSQALRDRGAISVEAPTIRIEGPPEPTVLADAARAASGYDVIAFTSANSVERFFEAAFAAGLDVRCVGSARLAAVGRKTTEALRSVGLRADVVPLSSKASALAETLLAEGLGAPARVLFPCSSIARDELPTQLRAAGVVVDEVVAYRTVAPEGAARQAVRDAYRAGLDAVLLTSASTAEHFAELTADLRADGPIPVIGAIGETTAGRARALGLPVSFVAPEASVESLVAALETHLTRPEPTA